MFYLHFLSFCLLPFFLSFYLLVFFFSELTRFFCFHSDTIFSRLFNPSRYLFLFSLLSLSFFLPPVLIFSFSPFSTSLFFHFFIPFFVFFFLPFFLSFFLSFFLMLHFILFISLPFFFSHLSHPLPFTSSILFFFPFSFSLNEWMKRQARNQFVPKIEIHLDYLPHHLLSR
ncbi:unnamed protein product [Acanthosepion pharaonis]|uniref:Uncharacterized protein n=1 Tax=Acanthosepion pharaonis TaxID=158019 RepID=A0A812ECI3_ACAPH|nr:unnamed protein product [Sepia pharaonis]